MNNKIIAAVIVVVLVVAGIGVYFLLQDDKDKEINIISGVNTEGSGLYVKSDVDINTMFDFSTGGIPTPIQAGWDGKIFGTPGQATIQHVQLQSIVVGMGMNFRSYTESTYPADNTVFFVTDVFNATSALTNNLIDGGTIWEPQYERIILDDGHKFKALVTTNELFPGHACCVIAAAHGYTSTHHSETVRFMAAFVEATDWVNSAFSAGSGADYDTLISKAKSIAGPSFTDEEIVDALNTVTYFYGARDSAPLANLSGQIAPLAEELMELGTIKLTFKDLGFENGEQFVGKFVDDQYILEAFEMLADGSGKSDGGDKANITVAVIQGDIHQIAVHMAIELGFFEEYGLNIEISNQNNGPGVAGALQNNGASLGLLGAPPLTINVINGELVKA